MSTVSKLSPYQLWEIDAIEGWLDDMAARGFLLESNRVVEISYFEGPADLRAAALAMH